MRRPFQGIKRPGRGDSVYWYIDLCVQCVGVLVHQCLGFENDRRAINRSP